MELIGWVLMVGVALQSATDTLVVTANNAPVWGEAPALVEEVRIGALDGPDAEVFGEVSDVAVTADGTMWISDSQLAVIRRFAPDGTYLGDVGREGDGPGEFRGGMDIGVAALDEGRMVAYDVHARRISFFSEDGVYRDGWTAPVGCITSQSPALVAPPAGPLYLKSCRPERGGRIWTVVSLDGEVGDTIPLPLPGLRFSSFYRPPFGTMSPFVAKSVSALGPSGALVTARTDAYALHRPLRDGRTVRIERDWTPVPVLSEERDQIIDHYERSARRFEALGVPTDPPFRDVPREKPPLWAIQVDDLDRIWVARHQPAAYQAETAGERAARLRLARVPGAKMEWKEPLVVDVLEPVGRFLGTVRFPNPSTSILAAREDLIWVLELGDFDEAYVVRYRIEPS